MNKKGKVKEITLGGAIILLVLGIVFLSQAASDSTGVVFWLGIVFLLVGIISLVAILISYFKQ